MPNRIIGAKGLRSTENSLDAIPVNALQDEDLCIVLYNDKLYLYRFDAFSAASEDGEKIVKPQGLSDTAQKRWILMSCDLQREDLTFDVDKALYVNNILPNSGYNLKINDADGTEAVEFSSTITEFPNNVTIGGILEINEETDAPLSVSSDTRVDNLNADMVDGIQGADIILRDGSVSFTAPIEGTTPTSLDHLATKRYVDTELTNKEHGTLVGLGDDDHTQYILVDGTRAFSGTISGVTPTEDSHLTTKVYVDTTTREISGNIIEASANHSLLTNLDKDDHTQYMPVDATRGFTAAVSGVAPTEDQHLATKKYVDDLDTIQRGRESIPNAANTVSVSLGTTMSNTNYIINWSLENTTDHPPSNYMGIVTSKTTNAFTITFSGAMDSANYYLLWSVIGSS